MRDLVWASEAWEDYLWWQAQDRKTLKRINALLRDIARNGQGAGIGKAEPLKGALLGVVVAPHRCGEPSCLSRAR